MPDGNDTIQKLSRRLLRQNLALTIVAVLVALLAGLIFTAYMGLLKEQQDKLSFHFSRLRSGALELERFVMLWETEGQGTPPPVAGGPAFQQLREFRSGALEVREVRQHSRAIPFLAATPPDTANVAAVYPLGARLADFYASFWAFSSHPVPQCLLLDDGAPTSLVVPAFPATVETSTFKQQDVATLLEHIRATLAERGRNMGRRNGYHWFGVEPEGGNTPSLMVYAARMRGEAMGMTATGGQPSAWIVCALSAAQVNEYEQALGEPIYDQLSTFSPSGEVLLGEDEDISGYHEGRNFTLHGLVYKITNRQGERWSAVYRIGYGHLLYQSLWILAIMLLVPALLALLGWQASRWYRRRVLQPVAASHRQLVESEAFSRDLIETAPVGLCLLGSPEGEVLLFNALAASWLTDTLDTSESSAEWRNVALHYAAADAALAQLIFATAEGRQLLMNCSATRFRGKRAVLCLFVDITTQHQAEQALARAKQVADDASNAKSVFLATISHEIRTPLYGVLGTLELLARTDLDGKQKQYLLTIQRASSTLMLLMSDILDITKIESGQIVLEPVEFSPVALTEEAVRSYAASAMRKGLQIYPCIDADVPERLVADSSRIRQIINNLLSNAIKFTDIGRVVIRLGMERTGPQRVLLRWQVSDTGIGISKLHQEQLFEPFYQANPRYDASRGTGLGLAICTQLARLMGGELHLASEPGLGSSFTFEMSMEAPPSPAERPLPFDGCRIRVRGVARELMESLCQWLSWLGADAQLFHPESGGDDTCTAMLDVSLDGAASQWSGPHVIATLDGPDNAERQNDAWLVSLLNREAIARALLIACGRQDPDMAVASVRRYEPLGLQVLVAEDNPINQYILREQLEQLGCSAVIAADGIEALNYWDSQPFDVVLSDINMPHMNGYELARQLRNRGARIRIIAASANASAEEEGRCAQAGMDARLVKPISLHALYDQLCLVAATRAEPAGANATGAQAAVKAEAGDAVAGTDSFIDADAMDADTGGDSPADILMVSAKMRALFLKTMADDIGCLRQALAAEDKAGVIQHLHRLRGALSITGAERLPGVSGDLEGRLGAGESLSSCQSRILEFLGDLEQALSRMPDP